VRKGLQLHASEPTEPHLSSSNYAELFSKQIIWFVDDSNVFRVTAHRSHRGNTVTKATNGAIFIFNPRTGQLFLKVIHTSVWAGQKRRGQLAKWKVAEEVAALIRSLPVEEQPRQVIATRAGMLDPLEVHLVDFPNITIRASELSLPFQSALDVPQLGDVVVAATEPHMYLYNIYDDWLATISPYTAFSRLILILRALHLNPDRAHVILRPDRSVSTEEHHLWPTLGDEQWMRVEVALKDLILADFAKRHVVSVHSLTQTEIRDIILGAKIQKEDLDEMQRQMDEIDKSSSSSSDASSASADAGDAPQVRMVETINALGEKTMVTTSANFAAPGAQRFESKTDWRVRALATTRLPLRASRIYTLSDRFDAERAYSVVMPRNVLKRFVAIADIRTQIVGYMYGHRESANRLAEVHYIAMPPQTATSVDFQAKPPPPPSRVLLDDADEFELLGIVHTTVDPELKSTFGAASSSDSSDSSSSSFAFELVVGFTPGSVTCTIYSNQGAQQQLILSTKYLGFFVVPHPNGLWNYNFLGLQFNLIDPKLLSYAVATPKEFFNPHHRFHHFAMN
jgi:pre-mRNA-processing factor 8